MLSVPWHAIGAGASRRLIALGGRIWPSERRLMKGAVHGLLVSPWFAAGTGFVIAAGAFMYAPHARLEITPAIGLRPCTAVGCSSTTQLGGAPPVPAGKGDGQVSPSPTPSPHAAHVAATTEPSFTYRVTQGRGTFKMDLIVTSKHEIGNWTLSFDLSGATNASVEITTQAPGADGSAPGGTAGYGSDSDVGEPTPISGGVWADAGIDSAEALYLVINGDGTPTAPQHCEYNGSSCTFTLT
jgi:hypothetical protein